MPCGPQRPISGITKDKLDHLIELFHDDDPQPLSIDTTQDASGTFTLTVTYPPCPGAAAEPAAKPAAAPAPAVAKPAAAPDKPQANGAAGAATVSGTIGAFPADIIDAAKASQTAWKVPAAVSLAQWALESGWGKRMPKGSNNPFGMKASDTQKFVEATTREFVGGRYVSQVAKFRAFDTIAEAFDEHGKLLAKKAAYKKAMSVAGDPDLFADALNGVYATDPSYGSSLKFLMAKYHLTQYD